MRAFALIVLLSGCSVEVCTRSQTISDAWRTRHATCFSDGTEPAAKFDLDACNDSMNACTASDEQRLQGYLDCIEALPVCTPESRASFSADVMACSNDMSRLSDGCYLR